MPSHYARVFYLSRQELEPGWYFKADERFFGPYHTPDDAKQALGDFVIQGIAHNEKHCPTKICPPENHPTMPSSTAYQ